MFVFWYIIEHRDLGLVWVYDFLKIANTKKIYFFTLCLDGLENLKQFFFFFIKKKKKKVG
jgi:hypothetical protein